MELVRSIYQNLKLRWLRWKYREGRTLTRFVAKDVRREILVVSTAELHQGYVTVRCRTNNLLYRAVGLVEEQPFGDPIRLRMDELWKWTGQAWGGLADGTSVLERFSSICSVCASCDFVGQRRPASTNHRIRLLRTP